MSNKRVVYKTKVAEVLDHTDSIRELKILITDQQPLKFQAGQFVMLHIPSKDPANDKPALRAYSIASDHALTDQFTLLFKKVPGGLASTYVWNLQANDALEFTGPFGRLFFPQPPAAQNIFLNTGSGVAQHLGYLRSFARQYPQLKYKMYFGLYNESEIYLQEQLQELQKQLPFFEFHYVLSQPTENWQGRKGYVQHFLHECEYQQTETNFFLCGNGDMIRDAKKLLLERDQLDASKILCEAFH